MKKEKKKDDKVEVVEEKKEKSAQRHPLKRFGTTEDISQMASFLLTEKSSWISGQIFHVDGGMSSLLVNS